MKPSIAVVLVLVVASCDRGVALESAAASCEGQKMAMVSSTDDRTTDVYVRFQGGDAALLGYVRPGRDTSFLLADSVTSVFAFPVAGAKAGEAKAPISVRYRCMN
ncbi:MAG: hypothetical protein WD801_11085 [Gemmatimonadaceae bacterium]